MPLGLPADALFWTDAPQPWTQVKTKVSNVDGKHDLYLIFKGEGENLFDFDSWRFTAK